MQATCGAMFFLPPSAFHLPPLLAQIAGPGEAGSYSAIGWGMVTLGAILVIANNAVNLWQKMWPTEKPPINEVYATKADVQSMATTQKAALAALEQDHDAELHRIEKRFEEWMTAADKSHAAASSEAARWREDFGRALGRIEGKIDSMRPKR